MQLEIIQAGQSIAVIPLSEGTHSIGRAQDNTICLADNGISRHHVRLEVSKNFQVSIRDLNSTNGTWLGSQKISTSMWSGDIPLQLGGCQLFLRNQASQPSPPTESPVNTIVPVTSNHISGVTPPTLTPPPVFQPEALEPPKRLTTSEKPHRDVNGKMDKVLFLGVLLMLSPFVAFSGKSFLSARVILHETELIQRTKIDNMWRNNQNKQLDMKLFEVQEYVSNENMQPAQDMLHDVLQRDPDNVTALAMKEKIEKILAEKQQIAKNQEQEKQQQLLEREKQEKLHRIKQLKVQAEEEAIKKDYVGCIDTAKKILSIDTANQLAIAAIDYCSTSLATTVSSQKNSSKKISKKEKSLTKLLRAGEAAVKNKEYAEAIRTWEKAKKVDPKQNYAISRKIQKKINSLKKTVSKEVQKNISLGNNARKKESHLEALSYFESAHRLNPLDTEAKKWYDTQLKDNHNIAEELYHEAIAYASLGSLDNAKEAIKEAVPLAKGNDTLLALITEKSGELTRK